MWTKFILAVTLLLLVMPTFAQEIPGLPSDTLDQMQGAVDQLNELPASVEDQVPLPDSPDPAMLWGYVKWLFSFDTAQELLGERMAWAGLALFHYLMIIVPLMSIYAIVNTLTITIKFVKWIISLIIKLLELIPFAQ